MVESQGAGRGAAVAVAPATGYWPVSELAAEYPPMGRRQLQMLTADITANGIREPLLLWRGEVVDGRHRLGVAEELGIAAEDVPVKHLPDDMTLAAVQSLIFSKNMTTRHLTAAQRAIMAGRMGRAAHGGARRGGSSARPVTWKPAPEDRASRARLFGVSVGQLRRADYLVDCGADTLVEAVFAGTISLTAAERICRAELEPEPPDSPARGSWGELLELVERAGQAFEAAMADYEARLSSLGPDDADAGARILGDMDALIDRFKLLMLRVERNVRGVDSSRDGGAESAPDARQTPISAPSG